MHFVCVGTPQKKGEFAADMTYVDAAFAALAQVAQARLAAGRQVDGARRARPSGWRALLDAAGRDLELAWNPEFLREGFAVEDTLTPDRLVFGVRSERGEQGLRAAFAPVIEAPRGPATPVVVTDFATAELVKVAANAFLATKISFINAMAEVCEATGGDVTLLSKALSYDTRIGGRFLNAGLGFGGGCLPKDIRAFMARAGELGVDQALSFLKEVDAINLRRRARMVEIARELVGGSFGGMRVAVLGAAFKPNSDDIRDSPALDVAAAIQRRAPRSPCTTRRPWTTPASATPSSATAAPRSTPPRAPTWCCTSPSGRSSARWTRPSWPRSSPAGTSSTAATRSTPSAGAPPAGPTGRSAGRDRPRSRRLLALDTWAVVGLSPDRGRAAYGVAQFLQARGKRVVPVHPSAQAVHGEPGYARLADVPFPVDVVDCFVNSRLVGPVVDEAVAVGAKGVWMQLGVVDEAAAARARAAGLTVVMDRCPKIEWR